VNAYPVEGRLEKAKDPLFGLAMGEASQISSDSFRSYTVYAAMKQMVLC
jgi:hypothetical protein